MLSGRAAPCSTQLAQEHAAEKRSCGRPRPGWAGPRWTMKKDGQPENYNYERYCAQRVSMPPKRSGKKGSAREKDGTQITQICEIFNFVKITNFHTHTVYTHTHTHTL